MLTVAQHTVSARQTVSDQIEALFKSKLRSQLDFSFASVNLAQAKLLLLDATNNLDATLAALSAVLGYPTVHNFQLIEDTTQVTSPPGNVNDLISSAFSMRPEILALDFQYGLLRNSNPLNTTCFIRRSKPSGWWEIRQCATPLCPTGTARWGSTWEFRYSTAFSIRQSHVRRT